MEEEIFLEGVVPWDCAYEDCRVDDDSRYRNGVGTAKVSIKGTWHLLAVSAAAAGPERCPDTILHTILKDSSDYHDLKGQALFCEDCAARFAGEAPGNPEDAALPAPKVLESRPFPFL